MLVQAGFLLLVRLSVGKENNVLGTQTFVFTALLGWFLLHLEYFWTYTALCSISSCLQADVVSFMTVLAKCLQTKLPGVFVAPGRRLKMLLFELCVKVNMV